MKIWLVRFLLYINQLCRFDRFLFASKNQPNRSCCHHTQQAKGRKSIQVYLFPSSQMQHKEYLKGNKDQVQTMISFPITFTERELQE